MKKQKPTHGGPREGSGAPTKNPAGARVAWSGRLDPETVGFLRARSSPTMSQAEIVDLGVALVKSRYDATGDFPANPRNRATPKSG